METETSLLVDLVAALAVALAGGWLAARLGLSAIVGYVATGIFISPFTPGFVGDLDRLRLMADIGVVLLMFGIGVQFSLRDLAQVGPRVGIAATAQIAIVLAAGAGIALALGWERDESLFVGAAVAISGGTILVKLLSDRGHTSTRHGRISIAWSVAQDLWTIVLVAVLIALTEEGDAFTAVGLEALKAAAFVLGLVIVGARVVPIILERVAEQGSRELFVLAVAALALGTALASERIGLSLALGAFLAGIVVSESELSHRVLGELLPARDVFAVLFFVSVGMLIDPDVITDNLAAFIALVVVIVIFKGVLSMVLARLAGERFETALFSGAYLAQAGEFSFVLVGLGIDRDAVSDDVFGIVVAAVALSVVLSPALVGGATWWLRRLEPPHAAHEEALAVRRLGRRAVVCGYGDVGRTVIDVLAARFDVVVVDVDYAKLRPLHDSGITTINGDASSPAIIEAMDLQDCRVLIVALSDPLSTRLVVERAHALVPDLDIVARAWDETEAARLRRLGASEAVVASREVSLELARYGLRRFGVDARQVQAILQRLRAW